MDNKWRNNISKRFKSPDNKRRKQIESESKLINSDKTEKGKKRLQQRTL